MLTPRSHHIWSGVRKFSAEVNKERAAELNIHKKTKIRHKEYYYSSVFTIYAEK